jgi:hypothetical protein
MEVKSDDSRLDSVLTVVVPLAIIYGGAWLIYGSDIDTPFRWLMFLLSPLIAVVIGILSFVPLVGMLSVAIYAQKKKDKHRAGLDREVETFIEGGDLELASRLACIARDKAEMDFNEWMNTEPSLFETWLNKCFKPNRYKKPGWLRAMGFRARRYQRAYEDRWYVAEKVGQALMRKQINRQFS